ncbi:MAG: hypothetical protein DCC68_22760 [Planctomycetota bacterium]|nr:MAG: hypothetical protein DCC68_22760 [Planctomycetota bacterium]
MVRLSLLVVFFLASFTLAVDPARAQRFANGRPSRTTQHASAQEPPDGDTKLEVVTPADPREDTTSEDPTSEPGIETDCDDRFHLHFGQRLGLGSWCRPRFGFGALRESLPSPEPMSGASWLSRPLHVDVFSGVIYGGTLIEDSIRRQGDIFSGVRLGWDWTRRLGGEMRFGFAQVGTEDIPTGVELDDADLVYWDLNVLWYPTGDTRLRPYLSLGLGALHVDFVDATGNAHQKELVGIPLAAGLKYRATPWCAVRADIADNIALPYDDIEGQGNFSITVSAEFHFGGQRRSYWPWNPTLQSW